MSIRSHPRSIGRRRGAGFSMLELVIVMLIIAAMAAMTVPRYARSGGRYRAESAARRLAADLDYARTLAITTSREVKIGFKKGSRSDESFYWFENVEHPSHPGTNYVVVLRDDPYRVILAEAPGDIVYRIDGLPKDNRDFTISGGDGIAWHVHASKDTGKVTVY